MVVVDFTLILRVSLPASKILAKFCVASRGAIASMTVYFLTDTPPQRYSR
jgi:hypothetical protein